MAVAEEVDVVEECLDVAEEIDISFKTFPIFMN